MGDSLSAEMLEERLHGRVIGETAILLIEAEVGGMKMKNQRGRTAGKLAQYVIGISNIWFR